MVLEQPIMQAPLKPKPITGWWTPKKPPVSKPIPKPVSPVKPPITVQPTKPVVPAVRQPTDVNQLVQRMKDIENQNPDVMRVQQAKAEGLTQVRELRVQYDQMRQSGVPQDKLEDFMKSKIEPLEARQVEINQAATAATQQRNREMLESLFVKNPSKFEVRLGTGKAEAMANANSAMDIISGLVPDTNTLRSRKILLNKGGSRASFNNFANAVEANQNATEETFVHEFGHWLEGGKPTIRKEAVAFRKARTPGEKPEKLQKLQPGYGYAKDEMALKDKWQDPYTGKIYSSGYTEVFSMGVEELFNNPLKFATEDFDYFRFMILTLRGEPWQ